MKFARLNVIERIYLTHTNYLIFQHKLFEFSTYYRNYYSSKMSKTLESQEFSANKNNTAPGKRYLAAFDFDHTIVAKNTDTVVRDILSAEKIPDDLHKIVEIAGWTEYMATVFNLLHENQVTKEKICNVVRAIPEVPGYVKLIKTLQQTEQFDLIIISDSNSVFINEWLNSHGLADCFDAIFTNPAKFESNNLLTIKPHHHQENCKLSSTNLCKGQVLEKYITTQNLRTNSKYQRVMYFGDGNNDICPVLRLSSNDIAYVRKGYSLERSIHKNREKLQLRAEVNYWKDGFQLLATLMEKLKEDSIVVAKKK